MTQTPIPKRKTWQREAAVVLLCFLMYLAYDKRQEELEILVWPFTLFAMSAFGFKQPSVESYMNNRTQKVTQEYERRY